MEESVDSDGLSTRQASNERERAAARGKDIQILRGQMWCAVLHFTRAAQRFQARMAEAINRVFPNTAVARDAKTVNVLIPPEYSAYEVNFLATVGGIELEPDTVARVVINERTGVIVATSNVRVSKVAVSHGSITISIASKLTASQPGAFSGGNTAILPSTTTSIDQKKGSFSVVEEFPTIEKVATALNALGVSTQDMMSIFQSMKRAGALQAELVLN